MMFGFVTQCSMAFLRCPLRRNGGVSWSKIFLIVHGLTYQSGRALQLPARATWRTESNKKSRRWVSRVTSTSRFYPIDIFAYTGLLSYSLLYALWTSPSVPAGRQRKYIPSIETRTHPDDHFDWFCYSYDEEPICTHPSNTSTLCYNDVCLFHVLFRYHIFTSIALSTNCGKVLLS
jgi:hypothetical protein